MIATGLSDDEKSGYAYTSVPCLKVFLTYFKCSPLTTITSVLLLYIDNFNLHIYVRRSRKYDDCYWTL